MAKNIPSDPFVDAEGRPRVVRGVTIISNAKRLAELAGIVGFETIWIDVEHGTVSFDDVETLCMAAEAGGAVPTVRIPDNSRENVLRSVEAGGRIIIVPMTNTAKHARQIVEHGKFAPLGQRGFNMRSRGLDYGMLPPVESFAQGNTRTHFIVQIETMEAVSNLEEMCAVDGLAGIFIGPGDLSASMGKTGLFDDAELIETVAGCIRLARSSGKHAGILAAPGPLLDAVLDAGGDLVFAGNDLTDLTIAWRKLLPTLSRG